MAHSQWCGLLALAWFSPRFASFCTEWCDVAGNKSQVMHEGDVYAECALLNLCSSVILAEYVMLLYLKHTPSTVPDDFPRSLGLKWAGGTIAISSKGSWATMLKRSSAYLSIHKEGPVLPSPSLWDVFAPAKHCLALETCSLFCGSYRSCYTWSTCRNCNKCHITKPRDPCGVLVVQYEASAWLPLSALCHRQLMMKVAL